MRWLSIPLLATLLAAGPQPTAASPESPVDEPATGRALTPAEAIERRIDRAVDRYGRGDYASAERLLGQVLADPASTDDLRALALFNRGAARLQLRRDPEAIADFDAAEALSFPRPAQLYLARGIAWENLQRLDRAAADYVEALSADPGDPSVRAKVRAFFYKP